MPVFISLLRGINVGGNKIIKMAELTTLYESLGHRRVKTLLQSGNVVFESDLLDAEAIALQLEKSIEGHFGFEVKIVMRTLEQWAIIRTQPPFTPEQLAEPSKILVMFLRHIPHTSQVEALLQTHTGNEIIHCRDQELFAYYPDGIGKSKLDNAFIDKKLKTWGTGRNWNTVNKLYDLAMSL